MNELHIDRLTLRVSGLSAADGRRLAILVAECLAAAGEPGAPVALERVRLAIAPRPGESLDDTARRIAAALVHAVARSS